ncbi:MAG: PD-(D/E)XK nuclease family protein [Candidatus Solibacter sp.]|jgi:hypothetical protein
MFTVITPKAWPAPPAPWHFSVLKEIEACPRRWALSAAAFPDVWEGVGYPPAVNSKALAGQVIHAVVSLACVALADAGCSRLRDAAAVEVLRRMGGFTNVLRQTIDRIIDRHRKNPRLRYSLDHVRNDLLQEIPAMRQQVQQHLQRVTLIPRRSPVTGRGGGPLREGSYHELRLRAEDLDFVGIIDLLQLEDGHCTIWEFKTGAPDERHTEQLRTYGLLWASDKNRNPDGLPVHRLVLSYDHHVQELRPADTGMMATVLADLHKRVLAAAATIRDHPPVARPSPEHCRFCDVRHLCPEYWAALTTWREDERSAWVDVELRVGTARGPRSWDAHLLVAPGRTQETPVVLVVAHTSSTASLSAGLHARLLNVRQSEADGVPIIAISALTEIFSIG